MDTSIDILVAEDSPTQAQRLVRILCRHGWQAAVAADGRQALEMALRMARTRPPRMILSDVVMPGMDGYELTRRVKAEPALQGMPVVLVTSMSDPHEVMHGLECGADCFILKPYDEQHLVARVQHILQNAGDAGAQAGEGDGIDIVFDGRRHHITAGRRQILNLLLSTYDAAIQRNQALTASQEALERARREAEEANRAKSAFLAAMSHEIRTPMNGVIGMVDVLHQTSLRGPQAEMVELIRESAFSLLGIIEDVLDFSKIEAGKLELESEPMSVAGIVETACAMLDNLAARKGVELTVFVDPAVPGRVRGDALRLRQVLINLANNAIKFSSDPGRTGRVDVRVGREGDCLQLAVADNGIGMDEATLSKLFTSFSQADVSITRRFGGTGLGLAISHHLTQLMGGCIRVTSTPGQGSTFTVQLPCVPAPQEAAAPATGIDLSGLRCVAVGGSGSLADDHAAYLRDAGAAVERVPDLAQAGRRTRELAPGVLVWVVDVQHERPSEGEVRSAADRPNGHDVRFVLIDLNRSRPASPAGTDGENLAHIDGNALGRQRLLKAVARVAGRLDGGTEAGAGQTRWAMEAPPRATAIAQGRLVLVTDDNETNQKVILRQLGLLGVAADVAGDGQSALARWRSGDYALLLTDLYMPTLDGYELTQAIRQEEAAHGLPPTPIVALSANAAKDEAQRCRALGMNEYLSKPVLLADLNAMLKRLLPGGASSARPADAPRAQKATAKANAVPVDLSVLHGLVGDNPAVVAEVLHKFRLSAGECGAQIRAAGHAGQLKVLGAAAHKLKSAARAVGAATLGELCDRIEAQCRVGRTDQLPELLVRFENEARAVEQYLSVSA